MESKRIALAIGSGLSLISSSFVIITFRQKNRRHPSSLILFRSLADLALSLTWLVTMWLTGPLNCLTTNGYMSAGFTEFFVIASEVLLVLISLDFNLHVKDPFTDYKKNLTYFSILGIVVPLVFAIMLLLDTDSIGESFLPICWTKYQGGRVLSGTNFAMLAFFYVPWLTCFYTSVFFMTSGSILLDIKRGAARTRTLYSSRRVLLFHCCYWGVVLCVFAPYNNFVGEGKDPHQNDLLAAIVCFLSGARGIENLLLWFPETWLQEIDDDDGSNSAGDLLSPLLNLEMQREVLVASVLGMSRLLDKPREEETEVALGKYAGDYLPLGGTGLLHHHHRAGNGGEEEEEEAEENGFKGNQTSFFTDIQAVFLAVSPFVVGCTTSGIIAIMDKQEPSFLANVFGLTLLVLLLVIVVAWSVASQQRKSLTRATFREVLKSEFQILREVFQMPALVICDSLNDCIINDARFSISNGRSGSFLYFTPDGRFVCKTISRKEVAVLNRIMDKLLVHARSTAGFTSLSRIYACFEMRAFSRTFFVAVFENVGSFATQDTRYDLKGSWLARTASLPQPDRVYICESCGLPFRFGLENDRKCLLNRQGHTPKFNKKDNDLNTDRVLTIPSRAKLIRTTIAKDVDFLKNCQLVDYSLLLCVRRKITKIPTSMSGFFQTNRRLLFASWMEGPVLFQFGIVDWLTAYDASKRIEFYVKNCWYMNNRDVTSKFHGMSSVQPGEYKERFLERVVDLVFPDLSNVIQVVYQNFNQSEEDAGLYDLFSTTLDITSITSYQSLRSIIGATLAKRLNKDDSLVCFFDDLKNDCFSFVIDEIRFADFKKKVSERDELCSVVVVPLVQLDLMNYVL